MKHKDWLTNETAHSLLRHKEAKAQGKTKLSGDRLCAWIKRGE